MSRINKMWLLMGAAVILGLVATWVTTQYLKTREARIEADAKKRAAGGATVSVVVPTRKLKKGEVVDETTMAARDVLADIVYEETVLASNFDKVRGTRVLRPVEEGKPLRMSDLDVHVKEFSEALPEGKRAITIEIDELNSIAQMVRVGNRLDLMLLVPDGDNGNKVLSVLQKVKIIATGQLVSRTLPAQPGQPPVVVRYSNVTFEVTPEEAARIIIAQQMGRIRVALRSDEDDAIKPLAKVSTRNVLQGYPEVVGGGGEVEFIIGGKGGGVGQTQTINVNMPGMAGLAGAAMPGAGSPPPPPAGALSGAPGQVSVPGVGSFAYPTTSATAKP